LTFQIGYSPGEVFLATLTAVSDGGRTIPWGYIYRLNPDRVTANSIDVVKEAFISSLWSEDGDLYFAGMTTRTFPPGNLFGIPKAGSLPDYDAFLGKSEGVFNSRRWMLTYNSKGVENNSGYCGYGAKKAYIVGSDSSTFYVVEYPVYSGFGRAISLMPTRFHCGPISLNDLQISLYAGQISLNDRTHSLEVCTVGRTTRFTTNLVISRIPLETYSEPKRI
jgi:hypothetical protein